MKLARRGRKSIARKEIARVKAIALQNKEEIPVVLIEKTFPEWCESLKIKTPNGLKPFTLFEWQRETAELITGDAPAFGRQIIVLSSRQTGKTSLFLALGGYLAQAIQHFTGVIIHKTGQDSGLLARRLKRFLSAITLEPDNLSLLGFPNGAFLHFRSSNPNRGEEGAEQCGRGLESVDLVAVEESGHTSNLKDVLGVVGPAMTWGNPKLSVLIGTAGSKQAHYYELLSEAAGGSEKLELLLEGIRAGTEEPFQVLNREGLGPIGVISNWRCIPEFAAEPDFLGRIQAELNLSDEQIASEYEMVFSSSVDHAVFDYASVVACQTEEAIAPAPDAVLYWGVDPSGVGRDYAVAIALEPFMDGEDKKYRVAHVYRKRTGTTEQHIHAIANLTREIGAQRLICESNSMGVAWIENLSRSAEVFEGIEGFATTSASKPGLVGRLAIAIEAGAIAIPPGPIVNELLSFRRDDRGRLSAPNSGHDDCVMALALALHAAPYNEATRNNVKPPEPDDDAGGYKGKRIVRR